MRNQDVENSQFRFTTAKKPVVKKGKTTFLDDVNISQKLNLENIPKEYHYKESGKLTEDTNGSYAMKKEYSNGVVDYFVKFATAGSGIGRMLNPWGVYFNPGDETKYEKTMGRKRYEFRKVQKHIFDSYIRFLETRSEKYILIAEREVNNGG